MSDSYGLPQSPATGIVAPAPAQVANYDGLPQGKREFEELLARHGVWVVYIRSDSNFPCPVCHMAPGSGEGSGDCPSCLGTGSVARIERARAVICKNRRSVTHEGDLEVGQFQDNRPRIYFSSDSRPGLNDMVLEVVWNVTPMLVGVCGEPIEIIHIYCLDVIEPMYFGGQTSYIFTIGDTQDHHKDPIVRALAARRR